MIIPEVAVVKRFFSTKRKYGFAAVLDSAGRQTDERIFLHLDRGEWIKIRPNEAGELDLAFAGRVNSKGRRMPKPKVGDRIVFIREKKESGSEAHDSAAKWGFESQYYKHLAELKTGLEG